MVMRQVRRHDLRLTNADRHIVANASLIGAREHTHAQSQAQTTRTDTCSLSIHRPLRIRPQGLKIDNTRAEINSVDETIGG